MEIIAILIGLAAGVLVTWLFLIKRMTDAESMARGKAELEVSLLNERLSSMTLEAARLREEVAEFRQQLENRQKSFEVVRNEAVQLAERGERIPLLEQELKSARSQNDRLSEEITTLKQKLAATEATLAGSSGEVARLADERRALSGRMDELLIEQTRLNRELAEMTAERDAERKLSEEKLALLNEAREELSNRFKALANEILEEKAKRFTEQNQDNIGRLLEPLRTKLTEFQGKVEEVYIKEGQERSALAQQVKSLMELNRRLSDDAHNLTRALKGSSKTRGTWGEMILERILESSGLRKGHEYDVQESHARDDGSRAQPDVILHLPEERHIIIDAKVTLNAYEEYSNAEDDAGRDLASRRHMDAVRSHIKGLSDKNYQDIHGVRSLDFVLMFIPVEPAFMLAISYDANLWEDAWKRNVLLVSPSTLLFVVRTIAHLWRQEQQNRNAQEIAKRGAELYDKLVGFVDDLKGVGFRITQARKEYDNAWSKFSEGRGNVIKQAQMLMKLGVKPSKSMPREILDAAMDEPLLPALENNGGED